MQPCVADSATLGRTARPRETLIHLRDDPDIADEPNLVQRCRAPNAPGWSRIETVVRVYRPGAMVGWFTTEVGSADRDDLAGRRPGDVRADRARHHRASRARAITTCRSPSSHGCPPTEAGRTLTAPNGTTPRVRRRRVRHRSAGQRPVVLPRPRRGDGFGIGRAGMEYRDLLPDRAGGRFIASHIRIPGGGDVADSVHFHRIRFQMIFCARGWVDLVYEDQGQPFRLEAGDCVLQPPEIRHRVLRASEGLEVIEIGCPAEHDTFIEHQIELPTSTFEADRGLRRSAIRPPRRRRRGPAPWLIDGLVVRDTGIGAATDGLAGAVVVAVAGTQADRRATPMLAHDARIRRSTWCSTEPPTCVLDDGSRRWSRTGRCTRDAVAYPPDLAGVGRLERRLRTARGQPARRRRRWPPSAPTRSGRVQPSIRVSIVDAWAVGQDVADRADPST